MSNIAITTSHWFGAGKVGLAVAFRLLELGLRILVVEKGVDLPYRVASYP